MHGWAIPQDNRMVHQIWSDKNNCKTKLKTSASIFKSILLKCAM